MSGDAQSLFEAEAFGALQRVAGHATGAVHALTEAASALEMVGPSDLARQLAKATELHRLFVARLAGILRQFGEAPPVRQTAEGGTR